MKHTLYIVPLFLVLLAGGLILAFNLGILHSWLERTLGEKTGSKLSLGSTTLVPTWPLALHIGATQLSLENYNLQWQGLAVDLASFSAPFALNVVAEGLRFEMRERPQNGQMEKAKPAPVASTSKVLGPALNLTLRLVRAEFVLPGVHLTELDMTFAQKVFLKAPASVHLKSFVEPQWGGIKLPLTVDSDGLTLTPEGVQAKDLKIGVTGLESLLQGESGYGVGRHHWQLKLAAPDLRQVPTPKLDMPLSHWSGALNLNAQIDKDEDSKPWKVRGDIEAHQVTAGVHFANGDSRAEGPLALELKSQFDSSDGIPQAASLEGSLDLTQLKITHPGTLLKPPGTPFVMKISAKSNGQRADIERFELQFWNILARVSGNIQVKSPYVAHLRVVVPALNLRGVEKIFLPLAKEPVDGELALTASFDGEPANPVAAHILVETLKLKKFAAEVDYDRPGLVKARGPVAATLEGKAELLNGKVKQVDMRGHADLAALSLVLGPLRKEPKQVLGIDFQLRNRGQALAIENFSVDSFAGKVKLSGTVDNFKAPTLNLQLELKPLLLSELRMALPEWRDKIPKGSISGNVHLSGRPALAKPWAEWPVDVDGTLQAHLLEFIVATSPSAANGKGGPPTPAPAKSKEGFLPAGYLPEHLRLKISGDIDSVRKETLVIKGVHVEGLIAKSRFRGGSAIQNIFSGDVQLMNLDVPLIDPRPDIRGQLKWHGLVIQDALAFAKPESKDLATGRTAGVTEFSSHLPQQADFMTFLKARGDVILEPVVLNGVKVGQIINDLVKQVPMIKMQPVQVAPLEGSVTTHFDLHDQTVQLDPFKAHDKDGSELQLKGQVTLVNLHGDLAGSFLWASPQVKGCLLEGNSDAQGRMSIPVAIQGDLMHPGIATLSDTITKLGGKAFQCEQKKLVERVQKEGTKQLENEVKKGLESLFGK